MMQDRKALQAGTSHFLGQNFAKASGIKFAASDDKGALEYAWTTSWGVSTRLIGGMIMTHADDDGLICPPKLAPNHVVIMPVIHKPEDKERVLEYCKRLAQELQAQTFASGRVRVHIDDRDIRGGEKKWQWVKKGVPVRVEVGPRDLEKDAVMVHRRDNGAKESIARGQFVATIAGTLQSIQDALYARALAARTEHTRAIDTKDEFYAYFTPPATGKAAGDDAPTPIHGGFAMTHFCGDEALEATIKKDLAVTVRCIPLAPGEPGTCPFTGKPSAKRVVWAKAY
jgi:prolyl-tRNA synthetase